MPKALGRFLAVVWLRWKELGGRGRDALEGGGGLRGAQHSSRPPTALATFFNRLSNRFWGRL